MSFRLASFISCPAQINSSRRRLAGATADSVERAETGRRRSGRRRPKTPQDPIRTAAIDQTPARASLKPES